MTRKIKKSLAILLAVLTLLTTTSFGAISAQAAGSSIATASKISLGTSYSDTITNGAKRFYKFTNSTSSKNTINATIYMEWIYIKIYDINGNEIWSRNPHWNSNISQCSFKEDVFLNSGTYYLAFIQDGSRTGNFNFNVKASSANESFTEDFDGSNNSLLEANSISTDKTYKGQLGLIDARDFYKLNLSKSGKLTWDFNAYESYVYLKLYDVDGNEIWSRNPYWNSNTKKITFSEDIYLTSGTYYFGVIKDGDRQTHYNFNLAYSCSNESFSEKNGGRNNYLSDANSISTNTSYKGQLALNDNIDIYKVSLNSSSYKLKLSANTSYVYIKLYDASGNEIYNRNPYWNQNTQKITFEDSITLNKGTYYIAIVRDGDRCCNYEFSLGGLVSVAPPASLKVKSRGTSSLTLSWGKVSGAKGYVLQKKSSGKWKTIKTTSSTSYTVSGLSAAKAYSFRVKAYKTVDGVKYYSSSKSLTTATKPKKVSILKPTTNSKHEIIVNWTQVSACSGYKVQYSKNSSFSNIIATKYVDSSASKYVGKNFTKGNSYYVRVCAYKTVNGTKYCGSWSDSKLIKCK